MATIGMTKFCYIRLIFDDPGVKVNGTCYCDLSLSQQLMPAIVVGQQFHRKTI